VPWRLARSSFRIAPLRVRNERRSERFQAQLEGRGTFAGNGRDARLPLPGGASERLASLTCLSAPRAHTTCSCTAPRPRSRRGLWLVILPQLADGLGLHFDSAVPCPRLPGHRSRITPPAAPPEHNRGSARCHLRKPLKRRFRSCGGSQGCSPAASAAATTRSPVPSRRSLPTLRAFPPCRSGSASTATSSPP